ncbi:MAG: hypothetical protein IJC57_01990 [Clostridia bacterium]|nr:hypothetical protein [Clostridia bacterium]
MLKKIREITGSDNIKPRKIIEQWENIKKNGYKFNEVSAWVTTVQMYFNSLPSGTKTTGQIQEPGGIIPAEKGTASSNYTDLKNHVLNCRTTDGRPSKKVESTINALSMLSNYIKPTPLQKTLAEAKRVFRNGQMYQANK